MAFAMASDELRSELFPPIVRARPDAVAETVEALSPWLLVGRACVQVKDANFPDDQTPLPLGEGTLPIDEFASVLRAASYDDPICLEWEKAWYPSALTLPVALASFRRWFDRNWPTG